MSRDADRRVADLENALRMIGRILRDATMKPVDRIHARRRCFIHV